MTDNVRPLPNPPVPSPSGGNGNGTGLHGIHGRLSALEAEMKRLATKEDVQRIETLIARREASMLRWLVGPALTAIAATLARTFFVQTSEPRLRWQPVRASRRSGRCTGTRIDADWNQAREPAMKRSAFSASRQRCRNHPKPRSTTRRGERRRALAVLEFPADFSRDRAARRSRCRRSIVAAAGDVDKRRAAVFIADGTGRGIVAGAA